MSNIKNIRGAEPTGGQTKMPGEVNTIFCTLPIYGGGNVLAIDADAQGFGNPYKDDAADIRILGISTKGSKNYATKTYDAGTVRIGYTREGTHDVCLANDNVAIIEGDPLAAESDSITYDGVANAKIGAVDKSAPAVRAAATTVNGTALAAVFAEYGAIIGIALEAKATSAGGYIKTLLCIPHLHVIPTS
jgi:hypothetical protein